MRRMDRSASATRSRVAFTTLLGASAIVASAFSGPLFGLGPTEVTAAGPIGSSTGGVAPISESKSSLVQDPAFLALKDANRIGTDARHQRIVLAAPAAAPLVASASLDTSVDVKVVEPQGNAYDDHHIAESDLNYWNLCTAGAVETALYYWQPTNVEGGYPGGSFKEPYGPHQQTTYWASTDTGTSADTSNGYPTVGRSYLMYIAMQVKPPTFSSQGLESYASYPTTGATLTDARDVLNWEMSGHASNWQNYWYRTTFPTQTQLHSDIASDIAAGTAVVASVNTAYLPNWNRSLIHAITVYGYNDTTGTYSYYDTCGHACNGSVNSTNGGTWTVSQTALYNAIHSAGSAYGGIDW
ncbi:MAG: cysteine peptidase family C39 domain-containing protein [Candidatus Limnocylindrales bacterium]